MRGTTDQAVMSARNVSYAVNEDGARHTSQSPSISNLHVLLFPSSHLLWAREIRLSVYLREVEELLAARLEEVVQVVAGPGL